MLTQLTTGKSVQTAGDPLDRTLLQEALKG